MTSPAPNDRPLPGWRDALREAVLQEPLIRSRLTLAALEGDGAAGPPAAVFIGLGLCSREQLSRALPLDMLGMLLPAERVRRAVGAGTLAVMVADSHALLNRFPRAEVEARADEACAALERVRVNAGLDHLRVLRASDLHASVAYRRTLERVEAKAPGEVDRYITREVADIAHLQRELGGLIKVGWAISGAADLRHGADELAFDRSFRAWTGEPLCAVYCMAGRVLDDAQPKASPYVTLRQERRICLRPGEQVAAKLAAGERAASPDTVRGVRNHLKALTRAYAQIVEPLEGPVEQRAQRMLDRLTG